MDHDAQSAGERGGLSRVRPASRHAGKHFARGAGTPPGRRAATVSESEARESRRVTRGAGRERARGGGDCEVAPMKDLTNPGWIKVKGILFLLLGLAAATLLVLEHPGWKVALLLALAVWSFSRFYYCAFYVIEHY